MEPALLAFFFFFFFFDLGHTCGYAVFTLKLSIDTVSGASTCRFYFVLRRLVGQVFTFGLNVKAMHHYLRSNSFRSHNDCLLIECITCKCTWCPVQQRRLKSACAFAQSDQKSCLLAFMRNLHSENWILWSGCAGAQTNPNLRFSRGSRGKFSCCAIRLSCTAKAHLSSLQIAWRNMQY